MKNNSNYDQLSATFGRRTGMERVLRVLSLPFEVADHRCWNELTYPYRLENFQSLSYYRSRPVSRSLSTHHYPPIPFIFPRPRKPSPEIEPRERDHHDEHVHIFYIKDIYKSSVRGLKLPPLKVSCFFNGI